jgi:acetylornithine deacetylase
MQLPEIDREKCLSFLSSLVQIKSYSQTDGEQEVTSYIAKCMRQIGLDTEITSFDEGKRQNVVGVWQETGETRPKNVSSKQAESLLFNGHLDTNPVSGGWTIDPWEGKVDEHFIYGIGVSNMKTGCAAYFCVVEALKASGWRPRADVTLTYVVGELQGGVGTLALIDQGKIAGANYFGYPRHHHARQGADV